MAGKISELLNFLKLTDEDDEYEDDYDLDDDIDEKELRREEKRIQREQHRSSSSRTSSATSSASPEYDDYQTTTSSRRTTARTQGANPGKVVPIHSQPSGMELNIIKPSNFGESQQVCDILLSGQPVIVNFEGMDIEEAQRIMDFISGCIFSISGNMRPVSRYIFIFSPKNVDISGDYIKSAAESKEGINFPTLGREF